MKWIFISLQGPPEGVLLKKQMIFTFMINLNLSEMDIYIDPSEETDDSSTDDFEFGFDSD